MKVLHLMAGARHGGAETCFQDTALALARCGLDQQAAIRAQGERASALRLGGVPTLELGFGNLWLDFLTKRGIARLIHDYRPDIVMAWMQRAAAFVPKGDFVAVGWLGGFYDLKHYRRCQHLVGMSEAMRRHIQAGGIPAEHAHVLRALAREESAPPVPRAAHATPEEAPLLLALGRLHEAKAFDVLLAALTDLPGVYLWIAGEGPLRGALEQLAATLGLIDRVRFLGWRNDRASLLAAADLCVFPSRYEPFGIVSIEAWANRVALVAAASVGPADLIRNGEDGLLVPIDDAAALASAIRRTLAEPELRRRLIEAGYRRFRAEFTEAAVVQSYQAFFREITR
ncbi:MAG: glycosyltransferase [Proteobacteria bacterium]|nr:glycosyltransferase [Pseudomonadota bacterium]MBI3497875.1 glycosyltransferase [Pseudomonadota bacterium]